MKTKILMLIALMACGYLPMVAQAWSLPQAVRDQATKNGGNALNFYDIQRSFQAYEAAQKAARRGMKDGCANTENEGHFQGYNQYKRWEWFNAQRCYPSGEFPTIESYMNEYAKFRASEAQHGGGNAQRITSQTWVNLGFPATPVGVSAGAGRVNCMAFLPGNANTIFVGTACGGVWKSTNAGLNWSVLNTDLLPSLSIASIAIDPLNANNIYIATGDNFAGVPNVGTTKQGHFSAGVYKSTDAGLSWSVTGLSYLQTQYMYPQQLLIDPVNPAILMLIGSTGILRNTNSGAGAWTNVRAGNFYSIEFNPLNHNVVYATDGTGLWRSNNNGQTWLFKGGGYPNIVEGRVSLAVTAADTNYVYLWGPTAGFKRTTNGGTSFTTMASPDAITQPYGYYDRAIAASPTNSQEVYVGGIFSAKTTNGGSAWAAASDGSDHTLPNYVHQDIKRLVFAPGSGTSLYALSDAGVFHTTNGGTNWASFSDGLQISELYRLVNHPYSADTIVYGTQDVASNRLAVGSGSVVEYLGGDGFQPLFDPTNPRVIFVCAQLGNIQKSTDGGQTWTQASPGQCLWVPPILMNPLRPQTMYVGCAAGVKRSTVGGTQLSYVNISASSITNIVAMDLTKADTNYIYAANINTMMRSTDRGGSWTNISAGLPTASAGITYITVSPTDPLRVYVSFSGYSAGNKVFLTTDGGSTWTNYSGTLPNEPVNCIEYINGSNDGVYIGTDFGVFYRDGAAADWTSYNAGLPNVIVNHLDVFYPSMKLRAGTYGRGIWESDLLMPAAAYAPNVVSSCVGDAVTFSDQSTGSVSRWNWSFPGGSPSSSTTASPTVSYATAGTYNVTLIVMNQNGADTMSTSFTVHPQPTATISPSGGVAICAGDVVSLTGTGGSSYAWSTGANTQAISIGVAGTYTVTVTDANGCMDTSAATTVVVNPLPSAPTITPSGATSFCQGGSVTLTSSAANGYTWSTGATTQSIIVGASGSFSVTISDANTCEAASSAASVTVFPLPSTPVISAVGATLFASAATSYQWYFNGSLIPGATGATYVATQDGDYMVVVTDGNGCSSTSAIYNYIAAGIALQNPGTITVVPNPSSGRFRILMEHAAEARVVVSNAVGQVVFTGENLVPELDLSHLAKGSYLITVNSGDKRFTTTVILQ